MPPQTSFPRVPSPAGAVPAPLGASSTAAIPAQPLCCGAQPWDQLLTPLPCALSLSSISAPCWEPGPALLCPKPLTGAGSLPPPCTPQPPPCATDLAAQAQVRYFGKDEPPAHGRPVGGIAPRDLTGPCPRGARRSHPSVPANRKERQNAAERWDSPAGDAPCPTRWSHTPGAPETLRPCGTAGEGCWARRTPAPGWSFAGAGR